MKNILERLLVCFYVLTKKEYFFAGVSSRVPTKSKAVCYYSTEDTKENHIFFDAIAEMCNPNSNNSCINKL